MCPRVNMEAPGVCRDVLAAAAPEGRPLSPPSCLAAQCRLPCGKTFWKCNRRWRLSLCLRVRDGQAGQRVLGGAGGAGPRGGTRKRVQRGCRALVRPAGEGAGPAPHWCWPGGRQQRRVWPGFDGLGSAFMFRLETARLG